ncbi:hypothetical protein F5884DRAFT_75637 [Xylogone sp. PMI_703]|nr:hypothetical protein F5884DRAFT_75637 [Xylogone sp. PMI_703]
MGLPLFIAPVEPEVVSKASEKVASGLRSTIRRQRPARRPSPREHTRSAFEQRRRRLLGVLAATGQSSPEDYDMVWENEPRSTRPGAESRAENDTVSRGDLAVIERPPLSRNTTVPGHPPLRNFGDIPPLVPEVNERQREVPRIIQLREELRHMARRVPSPPYTETDLAFIARWSSDSPRASALTPGFSPANPASSESETRSPNGSDEPNEFPSRLPPYNADQPSRSLASRVQALHALNRASSRELERPRLLIRHARANLDGLGDRDRSLSPDNASTWDTLLTGITPDPQPPSVGSSFASSSVANSVANSLPVSASTSMTSLENAHGSSGFHECDISDSGSNTDEEEDIYGLTGFNDLRSSGAFGSARRSYSEIASESSSRADRIRGAARLSRDTPSLGGMQRIISALAARDDIPDDWWAGAGLSRNLRREPRLDE